MKTVRDLAVIRAGDKGDDLYLAVACNDPAAYEFLWDYLTPDRLHEFLGGDFSGDIERYKLPNVYGMTIVIHGCLGGGLAREWQFDRRFLTGARIMDMPVDERVGPSR